MEQLCSIGALALILSVAVITLRRWHAAGTLVPAGRTPGGHRRYNTAQAKQALGLADSGEPRITLAYARVSSHDQKEQLQTQAQRLAQPKDAQADPGASVVPGETPGLNLSP